jgi:hypothetical protein
MPVVLVTAVDFTALYPWTFFMTVVVDVTIVRIAMCIRESRRSKLRLQKDMQVLDEIPGNNSTVMGHSGSE